MRAPFDALETQSPAQREAALMAALPGQVAHAQAHSAAFAHILQGVDASTIGSRAALACLPVTRKHELQQRQESARAGAPGALASGDVFGGFGTQAWGTAMPRVFSSPGPIYEPGGAPRDYWRMARAMYAAGFRAGDLVHNSFSYHFVPAGAMMESGAHVLGCTVFPAGTGNTEQQVGAMQSLRPTAYTGTPSFLRIIVEKANAMGVALPSLTKALVGGEAFAPSLRDWYSQQGIAAYQFYATAELGQIAYETEAREGLVVDEGVLVEIVRPGTNAPVPEGEVGEVVVTTFNPIYPLIRFGTGDLSAILPGQCPTGRTNMRIQGWLGRADQSTKIRGMFVHPKQVDAIVKRFPEVVRARLVVSGSMAQDTMTLFVEVVHAVQGLAARLADAIREVIQLRGQVEVVPLGSLPNDGKVIEDARDRT